MVILSPCTLQCVVRERAERQHRQTLFTNQQLMLRQSLLHNTELKDRLSQIQTLASGLGSSVTTSLVGSTSIKTPRPRTPSTHTQSFTSASGGSSIPRFGTGGKALSRFDSFVSVRSTMSETFFDALDDVSSHYITFRYSLLLYLLSVEWKTFRV